MFGDVDACMTRVEVDVALPSCERKDGCGAPGNSSAFAHQRAFSRTQGLALALENLECRLFLSYCVGA